MGRNEFLNHAAFRGGFVGKAAEAGAELAEAYCKADLANRPVLLRIIIDHAAAYMRDVLRWSDDYVEEVTVELVASALRADRRAQTGASDG